jgi:hypothetical protein
MIEMTTDLNNSDVGTMFLRRNTDVAVVGCADVVVYQGCTCCYGAALLGSMDDHGGY